MITLVAFDFVHKLEKVISPSDARQAVNKGFYCWADVETATMEEARPLIENLGFGPAVVSEAIAF